MEKVARIFRSHQPPAADMETSYVFVSALGVGLLVQYLGLHLLTFSRLPGQDKGLETYI